MLFYFIISLCSFSFLGNESIILVDALEEKVEHHYDDFISNQSYSTYARPSTSVSGSVVDPNIMYSFFENTVNNMGYNVWGSCGFIALEMILKYYDLYLNDNVVPEIYDQEYEVDYQINYNTSFSSNIDIVEGDFISEKTTYLNYGYSNIFQDYLNFIDSYYQEYFHLYLLKESIDPDNQYVNLDNAANFGINLMDLGDFANGYLSENEISCNVNHYIPSGTSDFLTYIKNKIDSGVPVILKLVDTDSEGNYIFHGVVAYDYSGSTIYFNDGYGINTHCTIEELGFRSYSAEILSIEIDETHTCNDDITINDNFDCICDLDGTNPGHSHLYTFLYITIGTNHYISCTCGLMKTSYHTINYNDIELIAGKETAYCIYCDEFLYLSELAGYFVVYN